MSVAVEEIACEHVKYVAVGESPKVMVLCLIWLLFVIRKNVCRWHEERQM